jgi:hypothetical protein
LRRAAPVLVMLAASVLLAACSDGGAEAPGGVSEGEAKALDEAAEMLDKRSLPPEALPPEAGPPPAPAAEMTGDTPAPSGQ